ncbi:MAG: hypothetical protein G01um101470_982 [Parcubacteria group bacterium Gr01-1014_70]|nr:MAG: hypothetical protein G01um101470_982 [Parcubacteria group bacterium Gr01-1014_70]
MIPNQDTREQIIRELELSGLSGDAQDEIIAKLAENLLKKIAIVMLDKLPEDKRVDFGTLASGGDASQIYAFLNANVPDAPALIQAEIQSGITEIKQMNSQAKA